MTTHDETDEVLNKAARAACTKRDGRSRELKYYYSRRQRGDHLNRIWSDPETSRLFTAILAESGDTAEITFASMVRNAAKYLGVV